MRPAPRSVAMNSIGTNIVSYRCAFVGTGEAGVLANEPAAPGMPVLRIVAEFEIGAVKDRALCGIRRNEETHAIRSCNCEPVPAHAPTAALQPGPGPPLFPMAPSGRGHRRRGHDDKRRPQYELARAREPTRRGRGGQY